MTMVSPKCTFNFEKLMGAMASDPTLGGGTTAPLTRPYCNRQNPYFISAVVPFTWLVMMLCFSYSAAGNLESSFMVLRTSLSCFTIRLRILSLQRYSDETFYEYTGACSVLNETTGDDIKMVAECFCIKTKEQIIQAYTFLSHHKAVP